MGPSTQMVLGGSIHAVSHPMTFLVACRTWALHREHACMDLAEICFLNCRPTSYIQRTRRQGSDSLFFTHDLSLRFTRVCRGADRCNTNSRMKAARLSHRSFPGSTHCTRIMADFRIGSISPEHYLTSRMALYARTASATCRVQRDNYLPPCRLFG